MKVYEFDATVSTHAWLKRGVSEVGLVRVRVAAKDPLDAELLAAQMAAAVGEVTGTYPRI